MKLAIISNMAHYRRPDGAIVGHGATARELDALASLFSEVRHVACLHDEPAPASALPYEAANITLVPLPPAGGDTLRAKLDILRETPGYVRTIVRELRDVDAVHVRAPANISLYAIAVLSATRAPARRWIKYAGSWTPLPGEATSYRLQRAWLAGTRHRAQVTINGEVPDQPPHVHSFLNPCLTDDELARGIAAARDKRLVAPIRLVFVGHLGAAKNPRVAVAALAALRAAGVDARLDLVGDGDDLAALRRDTAGMPVTVHGALPRTVLDTLYAAAHFVLLPSRTEGWPKVLSEGMAAGAVPIASAVGSIPQVLARFGTGRVVAIDGAAIAATIADYLRDPARWQRESAAAVTAARAFSYATYLERVRALYGL